MSDEAAIFLFIAAVTIGPAAVVLGLARLLQPKHSVESVLRDIVQGVEDGTVVLPVADCQTCDGTGIGACPDVAEYVEIPGGCPRCGGAGRTEG